MSIDPTELETVLALPLEDRYEFFLDQVIETGKVWGLCGDAWAIIMDEEQGFQLFPVWSDEEFALANRQGDWIGYSAKEFSVAEFVEQLVPELKQANMHLAVFKSNKDNGFIADPTDIQAIFTDKIQPKMS